MTLVLSMHRKNWKRHYLRTFFYFTCFEDIENVFAVLHCSFIHFLWRSSSSWANCTGGNRNELGLCNLYFWLTDAVMQWLLVRGIQKFSCAWVEWIRAVLDWNLLRSELLSSAILLVESSRPCLFSNESPSPPCFFAVQITLVLCLGLRQKPKSVSYFILRVCKTKAEKTARAPPFQISLWKMNRNFF